MSESVRLDAWIWAVRITKTRSAAKHRCLRLTIPENAGIFPYTNRHSGNP